MIRKVFSFLYFFVCASLLFSVTALAYIDPSAMTYIIQIIAGVAIAAGAAFSFYFRRLRRKFSRFGKKKDTAVYYEDDTDDDDMGLGDYEIGSFAETSAPAAVSPAGEPSAASVYAGEPSAAAAYAGESPAAAFAREAAGTAFSAGREPVFASKAARPDPYDEAGGEGGLAAENRELKRLLAEERRNVEELKRALHICTAPGR
ncbi:MAG: hypothetical protein HFI66_07385 [Lachnospiraceae bacterium]|nr:hypothetical protein [Lachnospiraceae bacterium]